MLEGLDKIDWKNLQHAYGSASDVPDLIRALTLEPPFDEFIQEENWVSKFEDTASYSLSNLIFHQGTIYEATAYVVPFFLELLTYDAVRNKVEILGELKRLVRASYYDKIKLLPLEKLSKYDIYQKRVYEAIGQGLQVYLRLLNDEDWEIRNQTAQLLSFLKEDSVITIPALQLRLEKEKDPRVIDTLKESLSGLTK